MGKVSIGVNMEFVRHDDKPFEWGVEKAAELGYEYVEPMVHFGRELLSEGGYFHSVSMLGRSPANPPRLRKGWNQAVGALRPFQSMPAGGRHGVHQASRSICRRMRRAGRQQR